MRTLVKIHPLLECSCRAWDTVDFVRDSPAHRHFALCHTAPDLLTLDEEADYRLLKTIIEHFGDRQPLFSCGDTIALLRGQPEWLEINRAVVRKGDA